MPRRMNHEERHHPPERDEWETPPEFFHLVNALYGFTRDVCASPVNAKLPTYWTKDDNALVQHWNGVYWCNPPYGDAPPLWLRKAWESRALATTVALVAARPGSKWFREWATRADALVFLVGRIKFVGASAGAKFDSALLIYGTGLPRPNGHPIIRWWDWKREPYPVPVEDWKAQP